MGSIHYKPIYYTDDPSGITIVHIEAFRVSPRSSCVLVPYRPDPSQPRSAYWLSDVDGIMREIVLDPGSQGRSRSAYGSKASQVLGDANILTAIQSGQYLRVIEPRHAYESIEGSKTEKRAILWTRRALVDKQTVCWSQASYAGKLELLGTDIRTDSGSQARLDRLNGRHAGSDKPMTRLVSASIALESAKTQQPDKVYQALNGDWYFCPDLRDGKVQRLRHGTRVLSNGSSASSHAGSRRRSSTSANVNGQVSTSAVAGRGVSLRQTPAKHRAPVVRDKPRRWSWTAVWPFRSRHYTTS